MDTTTVPAPPATREFRGVALYRERAGEIINEGRGVYTVPGCSGGTYTVHLDVFGEGESCDCLDFTTPRRNREPGDPCKHIICATIHRAKVGAAAPRPLPGDRSGEPRADGGMIRAMLAGVTKATPAVVLFYLVTS